MALFEQRAAAPAPWVKAVGKRGSKRTALHVRAAALLRSSLSAGGGLCRSHHGLHLQRRRLFGPGTAIMAVSAEKMANETLLKALFTGHRENL